MTEVKFSGALKDVVGERSTEVSSSTVRETLEELSNRYGEEFTERLLDEDGDVNRFVNLYVNGEDIRHIENLETELDADDELSILPAVSGG